MRESIYFLPSFVSSGEYPESEASRKCSYLLPLFGPQAGRTQTWSSRPRTSPYGILPHYCHRVGAQPRMLRRLWLLCSP